MKNSDLKLLAGTVISLVIIIFVYIIFFGPQSGVRSRLGGEPAKLEVPSDCVKIITFGKTQSTKYISYLNIYGEIILKEYSDWGMLEAEYKLDAKFDDNFEVKSHKLSED